MIVGPITLPAYIDRQQLVTRQSDNQLAISDFDHWAEPLQETFYRVITENLAHLLPTMQASAFNARQTIPAGYQQVRMDVSRFDYTRNGEALLDVQWQLFGPDNQPGLARQREILTSKGEPENMNDLVRAQSRNLGELSRRIAAAFKSSRLPARKD